jgi:hypothetical protein
MWDCDWDEDPEDFFVYRHQVSFSKLLTQRIFHQLNFLQRRLSDPSANLNNFVRAGWRTKPTQESNRARSENEGLDSMANGLNEIEAGDLRDGNLNKIVVLFFIALVCTHSCMLDSLYYSAWTKNFLLVYLPFFNGCSYKVVLAIVHSGPGSHCSSHE